MPELHHDFSWALAQLRADRRVRRERPDHHWLGPLRLWLKYYPVRGPQISQAMKSGGWGVWTPGQDDILADDWTLDSD